MSSSKEVPEVESCYFKWGKKKGVGGKKKEVQFYESFTYDGEEYFLHDCVYLYKEGEPEPYIGKLIKIWEQPTEKKRVKVLWFFRPIEILNYLRDDEALQNELFLASGEGLGLTSINDLEVIAGKCNVVCTTKNERNPQPSEEELRMADYIFHRTFNVDTFVISDNIDEKIAGVEDKFIYKRNNGQKISNMCKLDAGRTEENGKVVGNNEVSQLPLKLNSSGVPENSVRHEKPDNSVRKEDEQLMAPVGKQDPLPGETLVTKSGLESNETASTISKQENVLIGKEIPIQKANSEDGEGKTGEISIGQVPSKEKLKSVNGLDENNRPSKKAKVGNSLKSSKELQPTISTSLPLNKDKNEARVQKKLRVDSDEDDVGPSEIVGSASEDIVSDSPVQDKAIGQVPSKEKLKSANGLDENNRPSKKAKVGNSLKPSKELQPTIPTSLPPNKDKNEARVQRKLRVDSDSDDVGPSEIVGSASEDIVGDSPVQDKAPPKKDKQVKKKAKLSNEKLFTPAASPATEKDINTDGQPTISTSLPVNKDKNEARVHKRLRVDSDEDDVGPSEIMDSASEDIVGDSPVQDKAPPHNVKLNKKKAKLSNGKLSNPAASPGTEKDINTDGQIMEVSRRPLADRSKWFKGLPWEEKMETAHDQGTLVLLENLDPAYTSAEVEDIIWHGFRENCTAKVVQKTAISSPHSGQAFVVFKTRDAAEMAIKKLDEGCLMLPNGRPLVASKGSPPKTSGKSSTLVGHLFIDKIKLQTQREEIKQAVSTSHCSQPNTIEYEMALEWCLLQTRADLWWKELYKQHGDQIRKLKADLKSK